MLVVLAVVYEVLRSLIGSDKVPNKKAVVHDLKMQCQTHSATMAIVVESNDSWKFAKPS